MATPQGPGSRERETRARAVQARILRGIPPLHPLCMDRVLRALARSRKPVGGRPCFRRAAVGRDSRVQRALTRSASCHAVVTVVDGERPCGGS